MATHMSLSFARSHVAILLPPPPRDKHHRQRSWKRRRLKTLRRSNVTSNLFDQTSALTYVAPTIFTLAASGLALLFSPKLSSSSDQKADLHPEKEHISNPDLGEWVLFTSPTPFNRFVTLRCSSIYFPDHQLLDDVNEKLVEEDRHYVRLNSGRIIGKGSGDDDTNVYDEENVTYQRVCVGTEDGGVVALDWPANLELEEERGLDTTVLIVPGTAEGSNERNIRVFVCECLRRGFFPVVLNPRGCAGSPLTTARLFTAADSDDVSSAVQFVSKKRPWTTLMGVGWGYGANILTKYLAESGEKTPLTAATCIDNPFDLEEATRSFAHHMDYDQLYTSGLISILESNKELFQGRGKGFDVETALSASSIRDFEKAISMVSYGYDTLEEFYAKSSTRDLVDKLKVPVLFIQNDDGTVPMFSIPRSSIAENPYTSLLLCSYSSSGNSIKNMDSISWCQNLTIEWLGAVELGLLKGRHPLLKDVDVTINPSRRSAPLGNMAIDRRGRADKLLNPTNGSSANPSLKWLVSDDMEMENQSKYINDTGGSPYIANGLQLGSNSVGSHSSGTIDAEIEDADSVDGERGQVVQTAQVVMNMLDMTMPDTLSDEQKKKVLNAVGQGETLLKALQDAVPEDVRGKLTSAVSGILQNQGSNLKLDQLLHLGHIPDGGSGLDTKVVEKLRHLKRSEGKDVQSSEQKKRNNDPADGSAKVDHDMPGDMGHDKQPSYTSQKPSDIPQSSVGHGGNISDSEKVTPNDNEKHPIENDQSAGVGIPASSDRENASQVVSNQESSDFSRRPGGSDDLVDQEKEERNSSKPAAEQIEENNKQKNDNTTDQNKASGDNNPEEKSPVQSPPQPESADNVEKNKNEFSTAEDKESEASREEDKSSSPAPTSEVNEMVGEEQNNQKKDEKGPTSPTNQNTGKSSGFNVSQALDALTGFDDSTQVAVNSVFNVIEGMIDQLEDQDKKNGVEDKGDDGKIVEPEREAKNNGHTSGTTENSRSPSRTQSGNSDYYPSNDSVNTGQRNTRRSLSYDGQNGSIQDQYFEPAGGVIRASNSAKFSESSSENFPNYRSTFQYGDPLYKEYLKAYLYSRMRNATPPDVDKLASLYLRYMPEEAKWKLFEKTRSFADFPYKYNTQEVGYGKAATLESEHSDDVIEPSYVILDSSEPEEQNLGPNGTKIVDGDTNQSLEIKSEDQPVLFVKGLILQSLNVEVSRRISAADMEELEHKLAEEIEDVANAVSLAARHIKLPNVEGDDNVLEKYGTLDGENIINAITSSFEDSKYLRRVLPVGVIVGTSLAALRKFYNVSAVNGDEENDAVLDKSNKSTENLIQADENNGEQNLNEIANNGNPAYPINENSNINHGPLMTNKMMVGAATAGAVTAALGASALLVHENINSDGSSGDQLNGKKNGNNVSEQDESSENDSIVTSLAEKAMSVASPMVPMKEDGKVDHERLVAMLAELGQKGGALKLVAKVALLWGGIRGAMSLTDKLISFLRIAERPLVQRILGFVGMVLLLWSPVVIPLLPTLMQSWATRNPLKIAEFACIVGLYVSIMIMITLWGKRIRKYDDPLQQYGLDLASLSKIQNFLVGLAGGVTLVLLIHSVNASLGCVRFCWPDTLSSSANVSISLLKSYGHMLLLIIQGAATATCVSVAEELLFRSWLPQEIAADLGYHQGIIISGLAFALSQRSAWEIPGLWLLSLSLSGAQKRDQGSLAVPIGLRTGILACNHILMRGGFLTHQHRLPLWVTGGHPFQLFSGVVGVAFALILAVILYPRQDYGGKTARVIRE